MSQHIENSLRAFTDIYTALRDGNLSAEDQFYSYNRMLNELRNMRNAVSIAYTEYVNNDDSLYIQTRIVSRVRQEPQPQQQQPTRRRARKSKAISQMEMDAQLPEPCSICYESYTKGNSIATSCGHTFCKTCYEGHENSANRRRKVCCPLCREESPAVTEFRARKTRQPRQSNPVQQPIEEPGQVINLTN